MKMKTLMQTLTLSVPEYQELKECFQGGFTHANAHRIGITHTKVGSFDFSSSYPAVMVAFEYPMNKGEYIGDITEEQLMTLARNYCCMFRVRVTNLVPLNDYEHPLSSSKCRKAIGIAKDNGRVITAEYLETTMTEQDFFTFRRYYDAEKLELFDCVRYEKGYLPTAFIKSVLKLYEDKTKLKGVEGQEVNYMLAKEMLNSTYGMTVTDIVRENLEYNMRDIRGFISNYEDDGYEEEKYFEQQISRYNSNPYRFLFYPWGVWITSYARANLFSGIRSIGRDYIYSDTDSIKFTNIEDHADYIERYNLDITKRLEAACKYHGIDVSAIRPCNSKGEEKPLGVWDFEGVYDEFKTLGAKRYMWRKGDEYQITVAGINKKTGKDYLLRETERINKIREAKGRLPISPFQLFTLDLVVPKEYSGRNVLTYIDDPMEGDIVDYKGTPYHYRELSGIHMENSDYSFNPVDNFIEYLFTIREERW